MGKVWGCEAVCWGVNGGKLTLEREKGKKGVARKRRRKIRKEEKEGGCKDELNASLEKVKGMAIITIITMLMTQ